MWTRRGSCTISFWRRASYGTQPRGWCVFTLLLSILKAGGVSDEFAVVPWFLQSLHSQERLCNSNVFFIHLVSLSLILSEKYIIKLTFIRLVFFGSVYCTVQLAESHIPSILNVITSSLKCGHHARRNQRRNIYFYLMKNCKSLNKIQLSSL
jgi:hypothetical protein